MAEAQTKYLPKFTGGVNRYNRSDLFPDEDCYTAKNFQIVEDSLVVSLGYSELTVPLATEEYAQLTYEFDVSDGTSKVIHISTHGLYLYDGTDTWEQVRTSTSEDFTTDYAVDNKLTSAGHGLVAGQLLKVTSYDTLPGGLFNNVLYYVVNPGTNDFELALTVGGAAISLTSDGVDVHTYHPCFNGSLARAVKLDTYTPNDAVVFTNGVDPVWVYIAAVGGIYEVRPLGGLLASDSISGLTTTAVTTCRDVKVWNNRVMLFYTQEGANILPQQVRWSSVGDIEDFSSAGSSDGGYERLADKDDAILCAYVLGADLIVYRDGSIVVGKWVGSASRTIDFRNTISDEGPLGPNAVAVTQDRHFFFGAYNAYAYTGGSSLEPIGQKIRNYVYGSAGIMDLDKRTDITCRSISSAREIWTAILVAKSYDTLGIATAYKTVVFIYNITEGSWTTREFDDVSGDTRIVDVAEARITSSLLWSDLGVTWDAIGSLRWNAQVFATDFPTLFLSSLDKIYHFDSLQLQDNGVDIPFDFVSKDFIAATGFIRANFLDIQYTGGPATVSYSVDRGTSFVTMGTLSAVTIAQRQRVFLNRSSEQIRFRIAGEGAGFSLQSISLNFTEDSDF